MRVIEIDGKTISRQSFPYTIGEAGINHNGKIDIAIKMIQVAKIAGVDAIKFQTFKTSEFCNKDSNLYKEFKRCEFNEKQWEIIKEACDMANITFLSTPQNVTDLNLLLKLKIKAIKIGSDDLTNLTLIKNYTKTGLPIILSCGMAYGTEIDVAVEAIRGIEQDYPLVLMHCTSQYPTIPKDANMRKLNMLISKYPKLVFGYSDHTIGNTAAILGVAYGAKVFETHFTLNNKFKGPDQKFSKNPENLKSWVKAIHEASTMLGISNLIPTEKEEAMRIIARRSLTAIKDITKGHKFTNKNVGMMRPGDGLPDSYLSTFINSVAVRNISAGEKLQRADIKERKEN